MALTRLYSFLTGSVITNSIITGEFDNIYNNALTLISPLTAALDAGGFRITALSAGSLASPSLQFTGDGNTGIYSPAAEQVAIVVAGVAAATFTAAAVGPHAIGGAVNADAGLLITGTGAAGQAMGVQISSTTTPATTESSYGLNVIPTLTEFSSGLHPALAGINVEPTVTAGAGTLTTLAGIRTGALTAQTGTTNAAAIYVSAAATGATNNYAIWVDGGTVQFDGTLDVDGAATFDGAVTLGNAAGDNITVNGTVTSNLIFTDNTYDIGASGATRPRDIYNSGILNVGAAGDGQAYIKSAAAGTTGLVVDSAASPTTTIVEFRANATAMFAFEGTFPGGRRINLAAVDNGTDGGRNIYIRRNNNATTPAAGSLLLDDRAGTGTYLWVDNTGVLRINTTNPTNANDTAGTVVGAQTSLLSLKTVLPRQPDSTEALSAVLALQPIWWHYKDGGYNGTEFLSPTIDDSSEDWQAGRYPWWSQDAGRSLNMASLLGHHTLAIQTLDARLRALEVRP